MSLEVAAGPASPWQKTDRLVVAGLCLGGAILLAFAWWKTSGTTVLSRQVFWLNFGTLGLLINGVGVSAWLTAGRRAIGRRRLFLFGDVPPSAWSGSPVGASLEAIEFVAASDMRRFHRSDCPFARQKTVVVASAATHRTAGRRPCGVCLGDGAVGEP